MTQRNLWIRRIGLGAIALGLLLRFAHLDRKVYWHDEVFTSLRVAGYLGPEVAAAVRDRPDLTAADLLRYQDFPAAPSLAKTWQSLADHPEHPPLYYLLAHGWGRLFGASVAGYRGIAAVFGAIALGAMFWLGRQLFPAEAAIAWLATALLALSPVQIIYSQEAREYSLWAVALLLAHGALVAALQRNTSRAWVAYGLALGLAWYGSLMTVLLGLSHLVLMVLSQRRRQPWLGFLAAHGLALALFAPWIGVILLGWGRLRSVTSWANESRPLSFLAQFWGLHYSATVVDLNLPLAHPFTVVGPVLVLLLVLLGLGYLGRRRHPAALVLACGLLVPPLVLIGGDLVRSSQYSGTTRYFFPSLVLMPLAIAPLIAAGLAASRPYQLLSAGLLALLLGLGLTSGLAHNRALTWWNKAVSYPNPYIAAYINQLPDPVVLLGSGGTALGEAISLSYHLRPTTPVWLLPEPQLPSPAALRRILRGRPQAALLVLKPSPALLQTVPPDWRIAPTIDPEQFVPTRLVQLLPPRQVSASAPLASP